VIYSGLSKVLDIGGRQAKERAREAKERARAEAERRAQLVIRNMQQTMEFLMDHVLALERPAADAEANREAIRVLSERITALKQLIERRKFDLGDA